MEVFLAIVRCTLEKAMVAVRINSSTALYTVRPNSFGSGEPVGGSHRGSCFGEFGQVRSKVVEQVQSSPDVADLTEADRIVSGGRSLKSEENFQSVIVPSQRHLARHQELPEQLMQDMLRILGRWDKLERW